MTPRQQLAIQHGAAIAQLMPPADALQVAGAILGTLATLNVPEGSPLAAIKALAEAGFAAIQTPAPRVVLASAGALPNGRH